jgi:hypothetical protein
MMHLPSHPTHSSHVTAPIALVASVSYPSCQMILVSFAQGAHMIFAMLVSLVIIRVSLLLVLLLMWIIILI